MKSVITYFIIFFLSSHMASSQTALSVKNQGDIYFNNLQYVKAIEFYQASLTIQKDLLGAQYQLAESYRLSMKFQLAEKYYGEVLLANNNDLFPLARYYYGLMKKMIGEYSAAERELQLAVDEMRLKGLSETSKFRPYYEQANVEIAGCQIAIKEGQRDRPDLQFKSINFPVNSEYNEFAAVCVGNDSSIILSSGRKESKGILIDFTYGEYFSDFFHFDFNGNEWVEPREKDQLERIVNSKWGDGSGNFNKDHSVFYFTSCRLENSSCFIYKSEKVNGIWLDAQPLNQHINFPGFDSKHPRISSSGDTLFFSTNRDGGQGGFDIWYSVKDQEGEFNEPINMGEHLNTFLNEISPFTVEGEEGLFFASNGHKGFGGYDVFLARGESLDRMEIYNVGKPFNSNADDCFLMMGEKYGYISSNRSGDKGMFDIYQFNIENKKKDIISELVEEQTIAGRQSLYPNDYDFNEKDDKRINQIISQFLANKIADIDLTLITEDQQFYDNLSLDDKERIHRIVNARYREINESELRALRVEENFAYRELSASNRQLVDEIVYRRLEQSNISHNPKLDLETILEYKQLNTRDRGKVDQSITSRFGRSEKKTLTSETYVEFSDFERKIIHDITKAYFKHKINLSQLPLGPNSLLFIKQNKDNKALWTAIREHMISLTMSDEFKLIDNDRTFFQTLSSSELNAIEKLATAFFMADIRNVSFDHLKEEIATFNRLNFISDGSASRIMAKLINNYVSADLYFVTAKYADKTDETLNHKYNDHSFREVLDKLKNERNRDIRSNEDLIRLERFISIQPKTNISENNQKINISHKVSATATGGNDQKNTGNQFVDIMMTDIPGSNIQANQFIKISGCIKSSVNGENKAFPVGLSDDKNVVVYETYTDGNGDFEFEDIPSGTYQILVLNQPVGRQVYLKDLRISGTKDQMYLHQIHTAIYFNSGESTLRPEARIGLNDIISIIQSNNTGTKIELHGHTDNLGEEEMNRYLSKKRSEAVLQYLITQGISPQKVVINFHGLTRPVSDNTTPHGRQFNRRVEIIIQSQKYIDYQPPKIFLVKPESTLNSIAKHTGIDVQDIMSMNGLEEAQVKALQPLRLKDRGISKSFPDMLIELNIE